MVALTFDSAARRRNDSSDRLDFSARRRVTSPLPVKFALPFSSALFVRQALVVMALLAAGGCNNDDSKITVYRIPKETQPAAPALPETTSADGAASAPAVHWTAPEGWTEQPATGFRKGSFLVRSADGKQADISVISFPQQAGGLLANVNRWRDQLKLAPITNEAEAGTPMPVAGRDMFFVDLVSATAAPAGRREVAHSRRNLSA